MRYFQLLTAGLFLASLALPADAANRERVLNARQRTASAPKIQEIGGVLPAPVAQKFEKQNSPQDKLVFHITYLMPEGNGYVCYAKVVWGDLDNLIKGVGKSYYSNWDGALDLTAGYATLNHKIQFDDGGKANLVTWLPPATTSTATKTPGPGSGADLLVNTEGTHIEWKAGVVGVLDGLRFKITSARPLATGTLKAGNFTIPFAVGPAPAGTVAPTRATKK